MAKKKQTKGKRRAGGPEGSVHVVRLDHEGDYTGEIGEGKGISAIGGAVCGAIQTPQTALARMVGGRGAG